MGSTSKIMVSVVIVSYNQEKFLGSAIKSVLEQNTDFQVEILITDDASTDGSVEIAKAFQKEYPDTITVLNSDNNEGPYLNGLKGFTASSGTYFTWLDGDDFWANPDKLQTQIDFLESNKDFQGAFHDAQIIHQKGSEESINKAQGDFKYYSQFNEYRQEFHPWHLLKRNLIPTASLVFRNTVDLGNLPVKPSDGLSLNWLMQLMIIKGGKFRYFNEPWSIYNDHPSGISKKGKLNDFKRANIEILNALLQDDYYSGLKRDVYESLAHEYLQILLSPESKGLAKEVIEELSKGYLDACHNVADQLRNN